MYLGIDLGTSGVKAVIVDDAQNVLGQGHASLTVSRPEPLHSEQDPTDWWEATQAAVMQIDAKLRSGVRAIGLSGQMHGATCLDAAHNIVRPAILWNDGRSADQCAVMMAEMPALTSITGNLAMPGFTAPKLQWMRAHERDAFAATQHVLLPKDYVRLCMSGDFASDMSDSAGTLWMDVAKRDWSDAVLDLTGLTRDNMPTLFEGSEATGQLSAKIATEWGMARVPIAAGGGDNAAGAVGSGVVAPGDGFVSLGTSGVVFLADNQFRPNTDGAVHTFCHALPDLWHQMSVILSAASAVDTVARLTGYANPGALFDAVNARAEASTGTLFLPYLSGERTPHNDPHASGTFFGLTHEDTPETLAQAALEGVAFALADGVDVLRETGAQIDQLSLIGGGSRSAWWATVIASAMNVPLAIRDAAAVGPAFGAARLARLCLGEDSVTNVCTAPAITNVIEPNETLRDLYGPRRETFSKLYKATREVR
jgi:xylulokinase